MKKAFWVLVLLLIASAAINVLLLTRQPEVTEKRDTDYVVRWDTITDTLPIVQKEKVTKYIRLTDSIHDTVTNEIVLPVIQRTYSDDSTYTAYVSGPKVDAYPKLDSINVRQKTVEQIITIIKTEKEKKKHWRVGLGFNAGISVITGKPDITAGINAGYTW